jgi:hypothetical protein
MGKTHKSKQKTPKQPQRQLRKQSRGNLNNYIAQDIEFEQEWIEQERFEERYVPPSPAVAAHPSHVHRCVSMGDFHEALRILNDPNLDAEEKKYLAATYTDQNGTSSLHQAIRRDAPYELLELLVFIGGKDTVIKKDKNGHSTVHIACKLGLSNDVVNALCFVGGKEALHQTDDCGNTPLHQAAYRNGSSTEVVKTLIDVGGRETLGFKNHDNRLPVHCGVYFFNTNLEVCTIMVTEGIHHGVGGEGGAGGLFVEYSDIDSKKKTTYDKLNEYNLSDCLLKSIQNVVSETHGTSVVEAGAKHGLKWEDGMEALVEITDEAAIKIGIVALAAAGQQTDLTTIFELVKRYCGPLCG